MRGVCVGGGGRKLKKFYPSRKIFKKFSYLTKIFKNLLQNTTNESEKEKVTEKISYTPKKDFRIPPKLKKNFSHPKKILTHPIPHKKIKPP